MTSAISAIPTIESRFTDALPADPETRNFRRQVNACYSFVQPMPFPNASLLAWSPELGHELGLTPASLGSDKFTAVFSGNELLPAMQPYACCYGGHQFGHWAGQLGDGRAINLGEVVTASGQHQILQLKGAGPTPYSRSADGLAVLRSSVREFLCSEAMHYLGVPTTRALSLVSTGENVLRDMFYDGNAQHEPGAIVCRVAPSFVRFGSFEIFTMRQQPDLLKELADFTITRDFPHLGVPGPNTYLAWFDEICQRTASLMVHWMRVGFVHGVMNTDNLSILGLTIDYGPYGWLENYDPDWTPNTTDAEGRRYRFGQQPQVALWNLVQLANALYPLINAVPPLEAAIERYKKAYEQQWLRMMLDKLGLQHVRQDDTQLIHELFKAFSLTETDMTLFFRALAKVDFASPEAGEAQQGQAEGAANQSANLQAESAGAFTADSNSSAAQQDSSNAAITAVPPLLADAWYDNAPSMAARSALLQWLQKYQQRLQHEQWSAAQRREHMDKVNPLYVLRNWLAQLAIDAAQAGDNNKIEELFETLKQPYTEQPGKNHLAQKRPEWARQRAGCSMLSCSS